MQMQASAALQVVTVVPVAIVQAAPVQPLIAAMVQVRVPAVLLPPGRGRGPGLVLVLVGLLRAVQAPL